MGIRTPLPVTVEKWRFLFPGSLITKAKMCKNQQGLAYFELWGPLLSMTEFINGKLGWQNRSYWFQPIWKILVKTIWNHHPGSYYRAHFTPFTTSLVLGGPPLGPPGYPIGILAGFRAQICFTLVFFPPFLSPLKKITALMPRCSMYDIFTYINPLNYPNVG